MRIITISRQFGSGGRELGKRLSDCLGWDYYDRQILETLAEEFANLRYPVGAEGEDSEIRVLLPPQLDDAVGGSVSPGEYVPGLYKEEAKDFFRQCVGEETYFRAMGGDEGRRQHYVAARVFLDQADWKKFTWIEQHGTLDGYPG